jgi:hypothetical protein
MNRKSIAAILCLLGVAGIYWLAQAGEIDPPGPPGEPGPGSVEYTLDHIYGKLDACRGAGQYAIPKTGQTVPRALGDDGWYQLGVSVDSRFTDNGNGTVTDNLTGLTWLQDAVSCIGEKKWPEALNEANSLAHNSCDGALQDNSSQGDWRLPTVNELQGLVDYSREDQALPQDHPFTVENDLYWSSTTCAFWDALYAWIVDFDEGGIGYRPKEDATWVWPVRGKK